jgi:TatD DNase family protein
VRATVGIHPCEAQDIDIAKIPEQIAVLEQMIQSENIIVGIGEIGFDHYHLSSDKEEAARQKERQIHWFHAQVKLAIKYNFPVVIHTRNCSDTTLSEISESQLKKFVIHCFSEEWSFAEKVFEISSDAMISFTGILTYPKSINIQEVAKKSPLSRIMLETDAPYLIPESLKKIALYCEPSYTRDIFDFFCTLRNEKREQIEERIWENSKSFFNL